MIVLFCRILYDNVRLDLLMHMLLHPVSHIVLLHAKLNITLLLLLLKIIWYLKSSIELLEIKYIFQINVIWYASKLFKYNSTNDNCDNNIVYFKQVLFSRFIVINGVILVNVLLLKLWKAVRYIW